MTVTAIYDPEQWQLVPKVMTGGMLFRFGETTKPYGERWRNTLAIAPQHESQWQPIETAPKDGTLVLLLVEGGDNTTEDEPTWITIGSNTSDNTVEDEPWQMAGWSWSHVLTERRDFALSGLEKP